MIRFRGRKNLDSSIYRSPRKSPISSEGRQKNGGDNTGKITEIGNQSDKLTPAETSNQRP